MREALRPSPRRVDSVRGEGYRAEGGVTLRAACSAPPAPSGPLRTKTARGRAEFPAGRQEVLAPTLQGYLADKKLPPHRTLKGLCLWPYGGPRGTVSYERGNPVGPASGPPRESFSRLGAPGWAPRQRFHNSSLHLQHPAPVTPPLYTTTPTHTRRNTPSTGVPRS